MSERGDADRTKRGLIIAIDGPAGGQRYGGTAPVARQLWIPSIWIPGHYTGQCLEGAGYGRESRMTARHRGSVAEDDLCRWLADRSSLTRAARILR